MPVAEPYDEACFDEKKAQADENHPAVLVIIGIDDAPGTNQSVRQKKHSH